MAAVPAIVKVAAGLAAASWEAAAAAATAAGLQQSQQLRYGRELCSAAVQFASQANYIVWQLSAVQGLQVSGWRGSTVRLCCPERELGRTGWTRKSDCPVLTELHSCHVHDNADGPLEFTVPHASHGIGTLCLFHPPVGVQSSEWSWNLTRNVISPRRMDKFNLSCWLALRSSTLWICSGWILILCFYLAFSFHYKLNVTNLFRDILKSQPIKMKRICNSRAHVIRCPPLSFCSQTGDLSLASPCTHPLRLALIIIKGLRRRSGLLQCTRLQRELWNRAVLSLGPSQLYKWFTMLPGSIILCFPFHT